MYGFAGIEPRKYFDHEAVQVSHVKFQSQQDDREMHLLCVLDPLSRSNSLAQFQNGHKKLKMVFLSHTHSKINTSGTGISQLQA